MAKCCLVVSIPQTHTAPHPRPIKCSGYHPHFLVCKSHCLPICIKCPIKIHANKVMEHLKARGKEK